MKNFALILIALFVITACDMENMQKEKKSTVMELKTENDPVLNIALWWKHGSVNDPDGKEGLANLTARLIAGGSTNKMKYADIQVALDPIASGYGASCDKELTTFQGATHPDNIDEFLPIFIDAITNPAFAEDDFTRIKSNIIQSIEKNLRTASDEEIAKATLHGEIFKGTKYAHLTSGTVQGLKSITIEDVKNFYNTHFTNGNIKVAISGDYPEDLGQRITTALEKLPKGDYKENTVAINVIPIEGKKVKLVEKQTIGTSISFGFPISITRADDDFVALDVFRSWFGEHRNSTSHLYQVIREARGINYGDYAYIESFLNGGSRRVPSINNPRSNQIFEVWIRTVPHQVRTFSLRAAMRELKMVVDNGLTQEQFETTKNFLNKYVLHYAPTTSDRLGYMIDTDFYGINTSNYIEYYRKNLQALTLEDVNNAIKKHIQYENMVIAASTQDAEKYVEELTSGEASPITYATPKPESVMEEDKIIEVFPLGISKENIQIVPVSEMFEK